MLSNHESCKRLINPSFEIVKPHAFFREKKEESRAQGFFSRNQETMERKHRKPARKRPLSSCLVPAKEHSLIHFSLLGK